MSTVRWGVVGPGRIAAKVVQDFVHLPDAEVVAVASRSEERAAAFAEANGIGRAHGSYRAIVEDDDVDVLYIATPHPQHRAIALAALDAGKAVLVEKAFTVTPAATREIAELAARTGVFAMEAMWTRFQPAIVRMRELIADGAIGDVRGVQGELGVNAPTDPLDRYYNPAVGGGALFDLTVYPISFAQMVLGTPDTVAAHGLLNPSGVDVEEAVLLGWADGSTASLFTSLRCATPGQMRVFGTGGWIDVPAAVPPPRHDRRAPHGPRRRGGDGAAHRWRLRPRAARGHRLRAGGAAGERGHAARRHRRRAGRDGLGGRPARDGAAGGP